ncbi:MAG: glycosyltransferase family 2 protein [Methylotenera sp.]|nr:glycosyltransferase family 2 protein [Methylotenera sp.]
MPLNCTLNAVIIAKNESSSIGKCIESVISSVDRVVVYDTGSTDNTVNIAIAAGAAVLQGSWQDDFSLARNAALAYADADWNLIIDSDEWLISGGDNLRTLISGDAFLGVVSVRSDYEVADAQSVANSWITRLLPRGVLYQGRIHEQPQSNLPRVRVPLVFGHDGYTKIKQEKKAGRNRKLLELELDKLPEDAYLRYQIGKDCEVADDYSAACLHYKMSLGLTSKNATYYHDLLVRLLHCLSRLQLFEQGIQLVNEAMPDFSDSPDFFFVYGNLLLDCAVSRPQEAFEKWLPLAELAWRRCIEIGERPNLEGNVIGRGSYLAAHNLAVIFRGRGNLEKANQYDILAKKLQNAAL